MEPLAADDPRQVGAYQLRARLGAGGMGQVFLGYSPAGRAVAVKVIHSELARDPAFRIRFRREVAAARAVSGAYTAPVTAAGPDDNPPWLATVFVPGPSLAEAVAADGPLPMASVWKLAAGLVEALQAVHACGLVHRDLKPANVLLAIDGPRVIDFGISRALERTAMTSTGMIVGTPSFMSPEQAEGARAGPASDVFSLGCVIVFAATGAGAFGDGPPASVLYRIVHATPALEGLPGLLRELAAACLAKVPADRPGLADLVTMIAAGPAPDGGTAPGSFWPVQVAGLIRSYQARMSAAIPDGRARSGGRPPADQESATKPGELVRETHVPAGTVAAGTAAPAATVAGTAAPAATVGAVAGRPTAVATQPAATSSDQPTGPGLPADQVLAGAAAGRPGPGGQLAGLPRRRVLLGLAGAAVVAAGAGWELSRPSAAPRRAAGTRPRPATRTGGPTPRASPAGSAGPAPSGVKVWSFTTGDRVASGIAVTGGTVYVGSNDSTVYALRAGDGTKVWDYFTGGAQAAGITVAGGTVYFGSDADMLNALNASRGTKTWSFGALGAVESAIAVAGGRVYAGSDDSKVYALNASDGAKLWDFDTGGLVRGIAVAGGRVYAGSDDSDDYALNASDGAKLWDFDAGGLVAGIAVAGGTVYAGSGGGVLYALNASDGRKLWDFTTGGVLLPGIAVLGDTVYAADYDTKIYAVRAASGTNIWEFATGGPVQSGLAVAGGTVYAGSDDGKVYALNAGDGSVTWDFTTGGAVQSGIAVASGTVYAGSADHRVYALHG